MIELLFLVGGLATGLLAGLWAAHHLPARWRASTASEPRPEVPWDFDPIALDMWARGVPGTVFLGGSGTTFANSTFEHVPRLVEAPPPVDVQALSPPRKAAGS